MNIKQLIAEVEGSRVVIRPSIRSKPFSPTKSFPLDLNPEDEEIYGDQHMDGWIGVDDDGDGVIDYYIPDPKSEIDIPDEDDDVPIEGGPWEGMPSDYEEFLDVAFDSDGDGVTDYWIMQDGHIFIDTDGDGMPDGLYISPEPFQGLDNQNPNWMDDWYNWMLDNLYDLENFQDQFGPGQVPGAIGEDNGPPDWIPVNENGYVYGDSYPFGPGMDYLPDLPGAWHWDPNYIGDLPQHNGWVWYQEAVG